MANQSFKETACGNDYNISERIINFLQGQEVPLSAKEIASRIEVHENYVREKLMGLVEEKHIATEKLRIDGRGQPVTYYSTEVSKFADFTPKRAPETPCRITKDTVLDTIKAITAGGAFCTVNQIKEKLGSLTPSEDQKLGTLLADIRNNAQKLGIEVLPQPYKRRRYLYKAQKVGSGSSEN